MYEYAHVADALDVITGPVGSKVRVRIQGDPITDFYDGRIAERVVMGDALAAVVLSVPRGLSDDDFRVAIQWAVIESIEELPE